MDCVWREVALKAPSLGREERFLFKLRVSNSLLGGPWAIAIGDLMLTGLDVTRLRAERLAC